MMKIVGVHPIVGSQPCCLTEVEIGDGSGAFDRGAVTQEDTTIPRGNWQVAYDETRLNDEATRWAFFFHYLDLSKPLRISVGSLAIPAPSPLPEHLRHLRYVEP